MRSSRSVLVISSTRKRYNSNMLKSVVFCFLLWHEMCEFSGHAQTYGINSNYPTMVLPEVGDSDAQSGNSKVNYTVRITQNIFYANGRSLARSDLGLNANKKKIISEDYQVTDGIGAHKVHLDDHSWNEARKICISEGGHLAVIRSKQEERVILGMLARLPVEEVWIGFHNQFEDAAWMSVLDERLGETGWIKQFTPARSGYDSDAKCALLQKGGGWGLREYCSYSKSFVCKISTS